jgi:hypothetical protein
MTNNPPQIVFNHIVAFEFSNETLVGHPLPADEQCTIVKLQAVRCLIKAEIKRTRNKQLGLSFAKPQTALRARETLAVTAAGLPRAIRSMRVCLSNMVSRQRTSGSILHLQRTQPHWCAACSAGRRSSR